MSAKENQARPTTATPDEGALFASRARIVEQWFKVGSPRRSVEIIVAKRMHPTQQGAKINVR